MAKTVQVIGLNVGGMPTKDHVQELQQFRWEVGQRIRALRRAAGISQLQLATRAGLDHRTISRAENGKHSISLDVLWLIAFGLEVHPYRLIGDG